MKNEDKSDDRKFFTPEEMAKELRLGSATVRRWIRNGELKALKFGRQWRIRKEEYEAFIKKRDDEASK